MTGPGELTIDVREETDGAVSMQLAGELDLESTGRLRSALEAEIERRRAVVVDLSGLEFLDSTGLRTMLEADRSAREAGVELVFTGTLQDAVVRLLDLTQARGLLTWRD